MKPCFDWPGGLAGAHLFPADPACLKAAGVLLRLSCEMLRECSLESRRCKPHLPAWAGQESRYAMVHAETRESQLTSTYTQSVRTRKIGAGYCLDGNSYPSCATMLRGMKCFCLCAERLGKQEFHILSVKLGTWKWCSSTQCMGRVCWLGKPAIPKG